MEDDYPQANTDIARRIMVKTTCANIAAGLYGIEHAVNAYFRVYALPDYRKADVVKLCKRRMPVQSKRENAKRISRKVSKK